MPQKIYKIVITDTLFPIKIANFASVKKQESIDIGCFSHKTKIGFII